MLSKKKSVSQDATFSIPSKDKDYEEITYYDFDDSTTGTFKDDSENINKENVNDQDENVYSELEKYWGFVEEPNEEGHVSKVLPLEPLLKIPRISLPLCRFHPFHWMKFPSIMKKYNNPLEVCLVKNLSRKGVV